MRIVITILLAAIANLAVLGGPSLAKTPDAQTPATSHLHRPATDTSKVRTGRGSMCHARK
jgi:hypothetical protein